MICERCHGPVRLFGPVLLPHRCRKAAGIRTPLSPLVQSQASQYGEGPDWAKPIYGEYYAKSPLIYSALRMRAHAITRPALQVLRRVANNNPEPVPKSHPLVVLLYKINPFWTGRDLWEATSIYRDLWGSAFWMLTKSSPTAPPTEIWLYRPDRVRIVADRQRYISAFVYHDGRDQITFAPEEVVWIRNFNPLAEFAGLSPLAPARLSADMANDGLLYNRNIFRNGLLTNAGIVVDDVVTDEQVAELQARIKTKYSRPEHAHEPLILGGVKDVKNLGVTAKDMEFLAMLRWSLEDIARVYGVPKILLQDLERSTYENVNAAERLFWRNTVVPELKFLEAELNEMLVPQFGDEDLFVQFDLTDIEALQESANDVAARQQKDVDSGILTINEVRKHRGMEPVPWGDVMWLPIGMMPVEDASGPPSSPAGMPGAAAYKLYTVGKPDDALLHRVTLAHAQRLDNATQQFRMIQRGLFDQQRTSVLRGLRAVKSVDKQLPRDIFDPDAWRQRFLERGLPLLTLSFQRSAEAKISEFGLGFAFDVGTEIAQTWLNDRSLFWADRVNAETAKLLMNELEEAQRAGEGIREIQDRVEKVFRFNNEVRSEMIARTEIQSATNKGAIEAYRQSGVVEAKMWLTAIDGRERPAHNEAHRQVVPLESAFFVGGEHLEEPGDINGSPGNVISCRCTTSPVVQRPNRNYKIGSQPVAEPVKPDTLLADTIGLLKERTEQLGTDIATLVAGQSQNGHKPASVRRTVKHVKYDGDRISQIVEEERED